MTRTTILAVAAVFALAQTVMRAGAAEDSFANEVAALPPEQQAVRVAAKLKELNPNFDGKETHKIEGGAVSTLSFSTVGVSDISPVKALQWLRTLSITPPTLNQKGSLSDLTPLKGLQLTWLWCHNNPISDLTPLKGMPLTVLSFGGTQVSDLSPLTGMKLQVLSFNDTVVSELGPLEGMPLTVLWCNNTKVTDLAPLKATPLREIKCDFVPERDANVLRDIRTLAKINDMTAAAFWARVGPVPQTASGDRPPSATASTTTPRMAGRGTEPPSKSPTTPVSGPPFGTTSPEEQVRRFAEKMKELNPEFDGKVDPTIEGRKVVALTFSTFGVTDLSPTRMLTHVTKLICGGNPREKTLKDLSPLRGMRLQYLNFGMTAVADLSPLKGMELGILYFFRTPVSDLSPLKGMPLKNLRCEYTEVGDLSPLKGMRLGSVMCQHSKITDLSPLKDMPLQQLWCDFVPDRDTKTLQSIKTLTEINGLPVKEFWKRVAAGEAPQAK